jgi:ATP phosphoribosyltransferase regulatory subunit
MRILLDSFASFGFERVSPPLVEFDDTLDAAVASGRPHDRFRFMDPISQRSLAVREDITGQVARIAATRLAHWARPLRLSYAGPVLRLRGTQLRADRQFLQVGAELVGDAAPASIAEVVRLSVEALKAAGINDLSVDLVLPDFVDVLGADKHVRDALDAKDAAALVEFPLYQGLIASTGPAAEALAKLKAMALPEAARARVAEIDSVLKLLPDVQITLDPSERRGFEFQTAMGFSIFSRQLRGEVGRGGTYDIRRSDGSVEPAVGFSLYLDSLIEAGIGMNAQQRVLVAQNTPLPEAQSLRAQGYVTVRATDEDLSSEAKAQRCHFYWMNGALTPVKD